MVILTHTRFKNLQITILLVIALLVYSSAVHSHTYVDQENPLWIETADGLALQDPTKGLCLIIDKGQFGKAEKEYDRYLVSALATKTGNRDKLASALVGKAFTLMHKGDLVGAEKQTKNALRLFRADDCNWILCDLYQYLAEIYTAEHKYVAAVACMKKANIIIKTFQPNNPTEAEWQERMGTVYFAMKNYRSALQNYKNAATGRNTYGQFPVKPNLGIANVQLALNNPIEARKYASKVVSFFRTVDQSHSRVRSMLLEYICSLKLMTEADSKIPKQKDEVLRLNKLLMRLKNTPNLTNKEWEKIT